MKRAIILAVVFCLLPLGAYAQDKHKAAPVSYELHQEKLENTAPVSFELDEEKLEIEADIPSVDLIISFREIQERNSAMKASFLDEIVESAKDEPF